MKTKLMALEALNTAKSGLIWYAESHQKDKNGSDDEAIAEIDAAISALEADIAKPVEPFAWCIDSKNSADWCFSATESGVKLNAELMHEDCEQTKPFPVYTTPQEPAAAGWMPIETAPKDGTLVLIRESRCSGLAATFLGGWKYEHGGICYLEPTHWMPVPAAPGGAA